MSKILNYAAQAGLKVTESTVQDLNAIIFATKLVGNLRGLTETDGKYFKLDVSANSATEVTPATITEGANVALASGKDKIGNLAISEDYGLISALKLERSDVAATSGDSHRCLQSVLKDLNLKVSDVVVETQNDIIFKTTGINDISSLTEDAGSYYQLNTAKNTATLIDPASVAKQAKKDLLKGKVTDFTNLACNFNLISSVTLVAKD